jgi:hypothetical protein
MTPPAHEHRVRAERFDPERTMLTDSEAIHQEHELRRHRVHGVAAFLEAPEQPVERAGHTELPDVRPKRSEATERRHAGIRCAALDAPRIRPSNSPSLTLPTMPISTLASSPVSTHLLGAPRAFYTSHSKTLDAHTGTLFQGDFAIVHPTAGRESSTGRAKSRFSRKHLLRSRRRPKVADGGWDPAELR